MAVDAQALLIGYDQVRGYEEMQERQQLLGANIGSRLA